MSICTGLKGQQTIWVNDLFIAPSLDSLYIKATTCSEFTELYAYVGNNFLQDESIDISSLIINTPELDNVGVPTGRNVITLTIPASTFNLDTLNTTIAIRFVNDFDDGTGVFPELTKSVASYAGLYPCLIRHISNIDSGCNDCKNLNNALTLHLMMEITTAYFKYDMISEGIESYHKMMNLCLENQIIFHAETPGQVAGCGQYGGIGCWIVDTTFVVGQPYIF